MNELTLNEDTQKYLTSIVENPSHAYLFCGPEGLGKTTTAKLLAEKLLGEDLSSGDLAKWLLLIEPTEGKKISITQTKEIAEFINRSMPSKIKRKVVIIDKADKLSIEAANSLLLVLEEPPNDTVIILVSDSPGFLPSTILSRLQRLNFKLPSTDKIILDLCTDKHSKEIFNLIGCYPAKIVSALNNDSSLNLIKLNKDTSVFIDEDLPGRLKVANNYISKDEVGQFLNSLTKAVTEKKATPYRLTTLHSAQSQLYNNVNTKTLLENLALQF